MYTSNLARMGSEHDQELEGITDWISGTLEKVSSGISATVPLYQQYQMIKKQTEERKRIQAALAEQKRAEDAMRAYEIRQEELRQQQALVRQQKAGDMMPYLLIGGIGLTAYVLMQKKRRRR